MQSGHPTRRVRRFDIRMGTRDITSSGYLYPVAQILVDGDDLFADAGEWGHIGWPAGMILREDFPLLPAGPPGRVIVCGNDPEGPLGLAPMISAHDGLVTWTDFRDFWDEDAGDSPYLGPRAGSGTPVGIPDLAFDARQYTAEVRRATAAREWESEEWKTALLLEQYLTEYFEQNIHLRAWAATPDRDWELCFAEPDTAHAGRFLVTYWDSVLDNVIIVELTAEHGTAEDKAREMAAFLQVTPADRWPVARRTRP